jgi:hypothetical protein
MALDRASHGTCARSLWWRLSWLPPCWGVAQSRRTCSTIQRSRRARHTATRIPIHGCALPVVVVNGRNWEPDRPWPSSYPKTWKVTTEGRRFHTETYLVGTVRLDRERLIIGLPDGTIVNSYHPTTRPQALCA